MTMKIKIHYEKLIELSKARKKRILAMRATNMTWQQIADVLGVSRQRIQQIVKDE
jgi:DNA-directed RNA polymerase specialized sigma subunit